MTSWAFQLYLCVGSGCVAQRMLLAVLLFGVYVAYRSIRAVCFVLELSDMLCLSPTELPCMPWAVTHGHHQQSCLAIAP